MTANVSPPTQTPQGQPCSTGVGNNPLTIPEHSQRAVSRMPKARRSRLSLTRCAGCATLPNHKPRRQRFVVNPSSARSTLFDRGWQQPLDHPGAQPACRVKDAEGTAQPLVLDSVRWLCYLPKSQAAPHRPHFPAVLTSMLCPSLLNTIVPSSSVRSTFTPALPSVSIVLSAG